MELPEILDAVASSDKQRFSLLYVPPASNATEEEQSKEHRQQNEDDLAVETASSEAKQKSATAHALATKDREPSHFLIRATQGHSIDSIDTTLFLERLNLNDSPNEDSALSSKASPLPDTVVHGTYHGAWPLILASGGLRAMRRTQVHFATGPTINDILPDGRSGAPAKMPDRSSSKQTVISGMRSDAEILIYIDLKKALQAGCPFYRSENGVILSEGLALREDEGSETSPPKLVPIEFFDTVVERKAGLGVLWENGEVVQELPADLAGKKNPKSFRGGGGRGRGRGRGRDK